MDSQCAALRHQNLVRGIINKRFLGLLHYGYDYDDLIQEGLYAVMKAEPLYDPTKGSESTYYYRAVYNWLSWRVGTRKINGLDRAYKDTLRLDRHAVSANGDAMECTLLDLMIDPDAEFEARTVELINLKAALTKLRNCDPRLAEVIRCRFWDELALKDIGARMGFSRQRAEQLLSRGLTALREYMAEEKTA